MASTQETRVYSTLFSLTLDDHRRELHDQVHGAIPLTWWMMNKGRGRDRGMGKGVRTQHGGKKIIIPVIQAQNPNAKWYNRYENMTVQTSDEVTAALDTMRQLSLTVGISGDEIDSNSGMAQIRDMLRDKMDILEMTGAEMLETSLMQGEASGLRFIAGTSGKAINPLGWLIQKAFGTADGVHEINQATNPWWRNRVKLSANTTSLGARNEMNNLYNSCSRGSSNDHPDLIISDQNYFEYYENHLQANQRYGNYGDDGAASSHFESVKFKGAMMFWSEYMPNPGSTAADAASLTQATDEAAAFFLNSRWLELVVSARINFTPSPFQEPYDQDALWAKVLWRGQMTCKQRRKQGLHHNVDTTTVT